MSSLQRGVDFQSALTRMTRAAKPRSLLMSRDTLAGIRDLALHAAIDIAWAQWSCQTHTAAATDTRPVD